MTWVDNDLTKLAGGTPTDPAGSRALDGYSQGDGSQHVNFIDADGHVHELYRSPDPAAQWADNDLTRLAGGTPAFNVIEGSALLRSALAGYAQGDGSQHVNYIDAAGRVHELYKSPDPAAQWADNDLTRLAGGPPGSTQAGPLDLAGYSQRDGSQHVNYIESADPGDVHELYRSPDPAAQWADNDLTELAPSPVGGNPPLPLFTAVISAYSQRDGSQHVNFIDINLLHVHELYRSPDPAAQWVSNDLTEFARGTLAADGGGVLHGYSQGDGSQHVNFIDADGHVHELYKSPDPAAQWADNDLTRLAGGTPANGRALDGYSQGDGSQHVNFIDADGHVHELYKSPDPAAQWADNDLTRLAGGTPAFNVIEGRSPLDGYSQGDGSQHVNFIAADGHVHELYRSP